MKSASIWDNILSLFVGGGGFFKAETWKMMGYLVLRGLFGAIVIIGMTSLLDKFEDSVYDVIGGKPSTSLGAGFEGTASDAIKSGAEAGVSAGKFGMQAAKTFMKLPLLALGAAAGILGGLSKNLKQGINFVKNKIKDGQQFIANKFNKLKDGIADGLQAVKNKILNIFPGNSNNKNIEINNVNNVANQQINNENNRYQQTVNNLNNRQSEIDNALATLQNQGNSGVNKNDGKTDQQRFDESVQRELQKRELLQEKANIAKALRDNERQHITTLSNINAERNSRQRDIDTKYKYGCDDREAHMRNRAEDAGVSYRQIKREAEERGTTDVQILYEYEYKKYN